MKTSPYHLHLTTKTTYFDGAESLEINLEVCRLDPATSAPRGIEYDTFERNDPARGLAYLNWHASARADRPEWSVAVYARLTNLEYGNVEHARIAVAAYDRLTKQLDKLTTAAGAATTPGAAAQRIASCLKLAGMVRTHPREPQYWQTLGIDSIASVIDNAVYDFRQKHAPQAATAAA